MEYLGQKVYTFYILIVKFMDVHFIIIYSGKKLELVKGIVVHLYNRIPHRLYKERGKSIGMI